MFVFDTTSSSFQTSFSPPPTGSSPPATTLPGASPTSGPGSSPGSSGGGQSGSPGSGTNSNAPGSSNDSGSGSGSGNGGGNNDGGQGNGSSSDPHSHATAVALGTVFGIIGLMLGTTAALYYARRRSRSQESFRLLSPTSEDEDSPHLGPVIPIAGGTVREKGLPPVVQSVRDRLSGFVPGRTVRNLPGRRDMLADEDTRHFETNRLDGLGGIRRDPSSTQSSIRRPSFGDKMYDSLASLRSVGGAMLDYAAGTSVMRNMRKEGSGGSRSMWAKSEKEASDPFADDWGLINAKRPRTDRQASAYSYVDPFEDYEVQSIKFDYDAPPYADHDDEERGYPRLSDPPPRPYLHSSLAPAVDLTHHSSVSARPSLATLTESGNTPSDSSHSNPPASPFNTAFSASTSSHDIPRSPTRPSSLMDANPLNQTPSSPMRRSNSWWLRFAKTPLLDRRSSDAGRQPLPIDFRDPNPPPSRLVPIEEASSVSPTDSKRGSSSGGGVGGGHHQLWSSHAHGRSASSLQTLQTATSEALERIGQMDVVQRGSHGVDQSSSGGGDPGRPNTRLQRPLSVVTTGSASSTLLTDEESSSLVMSPESILDPRSDERPGRTSSPPPARKRSPTGNVAQRIQAFERRMTQEEAPLKSPPPVRPRHRASVYGVAPKPSLYVTNPDRERSGSGGS